MSVHLETDLVPDRGHELPLVDEARTIAPTFVLADGRVVAAPTSWSRRLRTASQSQRDHFEIEPEGLIVEWPDVDEHVGVWALLGVSEEDAMSAVGLKVLQPADR